MKTLSSPTLSHIAGDVTTLAMCWKVVRDDTTVLGFTDHDVDLVIDSVTYLASTGINPHNIESTDNFRVNNTEVGGIIDSSVITESDILAGLYDFASVTIFAVNYEDTSQQIDLFQGNLGELRSSGSSSSFFAELRGLSAKLQKPVGRLIQANCDADLGDSRCGVDLGALTVSSVVVAAVTSQLVFTTTDATVIAQANGYYSGGTVTFTTGGNSGKGKVSKMEIKTFSVTGGVATISLHLPMSFTIAVSDQFSIAPGCDKTLATCKTKFSNVVNFRGFPTVPGQDQGLSYVIGR